MSFASPSFRPRVEALEDRRLLAGVELTHGGHDDTSGGSSVDAPIVAPDSPGVELPTVTVTVERQDTCDVLVVCVRSTQPTQHVSVDGGEGEWTDFNGFARLNVPFDTLMVDLQITNLQGAALPGLRIVFDGDGHVVAQFWGASAGGSTGSTSSATNLAPLDPNLFSHGHQGGTTTSSIDAMSEDHSPHAAALPVANAHDAGAAAMHDAWERRGAANHVISLSPRELSPLAPAERGEGHGPSLRGATGEAAPAEAVAAARESTADEAADVALATDWVGGSLDSGDLEAGGVLEVLAKRWHDSSMASSKTESAPTGPVAVARAVTPTAPPQAKSETSEDEEGDEQNSWSVAAWVAAAVAAGTAAVVVDRRTKRTAEEKANPS